MADQDIDDYNQGLDAAGIPPEEAAIEDTGGPVLGPAEALNLAGPPSQKTQMLLENHPEISPDYEDTVLEKLVITGAYPPTKMNNHHSSSPFLTLYERTKILCLRASQLAHGSPPFIDVPEYLTDVYEIAKAELEAKRIPLILKRQMPDGNYEYWRLADLMLL
jgi:DNA-directed RNA polymerase I, II, and III subunit RPABC2